MHIGYGYIPLTQITCNLQKEKYTNNPTLLNTSNYFHYTTNSYLISPHKLDNSPYKVYISSHSNNTLQYTHIYLHFSQRTLPHHIHYK